MKARAQGGLLYVPVELEFRGQKLLVDDAIVDTGSAASIFAADLVLALGLVPEPFDRLRRIRGVGGVEFVFTKTVDFLRAGPLEASSFEVEIGALDYGFPVGGILGLDFLRHTGAVIDLSALELRQGRAAQS